MLLSNPRAHRTLHISRSHSVLPALFVSLCLCGCGPSNTLDQDVVSLDVRADVGPATQRVTVEITGADGEEDPAVDLEVTDEVASGDIEVTRGSDRTLRIIVYDSRGVATHRGSVTLDVTERETPAIAVSLEPGTGERPRMAIVESFIVAVDPAAVEAVAGDTVRIGAAVLDAYDDTLHVAVRWRSLGPARAVVDSTGLVTVVAPGTIPIVASVAGVGAVATLTVSAGSR